MASAVQESLVSEEVVHDLDTCEVTVEGEELNPEQESLEVDAVRLQQKGIEVSHSDLGVVLRGERGSAFIQGGAGCGGFMLEGQCPMCCLCVPQLEGHSGGPTGSATQHLTLAAFL